MTCARAAVIGGGLLGLEAARGLLELGVEVHVIHLARHLMEVQLDEGAGGLLRTALDKLGVHTHLERRTTAVLGAPRVSGLLFDDGSRLECEMVVVSAGIRPNAGLARAAGLTVERGIVVGDDLSCANDPDVFAIGECAQHRGQVYGLVAPLWEQAQILADRLTGRNLGALSRRFPVSTKLKVMGVDLSVMGDKEPSPGDEVVQSLRTGARDLQADARARRPVGRCHPARQSRLHAWPASGFRPRLPAPRRPLGGAVSWCTARRGVLGGHAG